MTLQDVFGNIRDFYQRIFWEWEDSATEHGDGYVMNFSGLRWLSGANQLWVDDPAVVTPRLLSRCAEFFRPFFAEWSIVVIEHQHADLLDRCLKKYGCYVRWDSPIMLLDRTPQFPPNNPSSNQVVRVHGDHSRNIMRNIIAEAFHMDAVVNHRLMRPEHDHDPTIQHYLAYRDGHPAAAATMTYTDTIAGIWNVGTRRIFRRRGLASSLMQQMLIDADARGYTASTLIASNMGQPLYQKMGYRTIAMIYYLGYVAF